MENMVYYVICGSLTSSVINCYGCGMDAESVGVLLEVVGVSYLLVMYFK